jgi:hypothetical protein
MRWRGLVTLVGFRWSETGRERRRGMIVVAAIAALMSLGGMLVLGPSERGGVRVMRSVDAADARRPIRELGEGAWPAAIVISLVWPGSLVVAYALANGPL